MKPQEFTRRSRMRRTSTGKRIALSERDRELFRLLARYRLLRSTYLHAFLGGSPKRFIERLGDLYHEGFLDRPEQQWNSANARTMPVVYCLGAKAYRALEEGGEGFAPERYSVSRQFAHELMICEILASIELGARQTPGLRFIPFPEILTYAPQATKAKANPLAIPIGITGATLVPDALFGLAYEGTSPATYRFFALEADRATMPVFRSSRTQTSYGRKLAAYREGLANGTIRSWFGLPNLLVLTVSVNEQHLRNIMAARDKAIGGSGSPVLLFKTLSPPDGYQAMSIPTPALLTTPWARVGHAPFRIDEV